MGQLILSSLGAAAGQSLLPNGLSLFGATLSGQAIGGFAGSVLGAALDRALMPQPTLEGPRIDSLQVQTSREGAAIPIVFGRGRIAGQVIWASRFREHHDTQGGGKGRPRVRHFSYSVSVAIGLCEGVIGGIGRVWANGELLDQSAYPFRLYTGTEDQLPDPLIAAVEGAANAPAYRGLAYAVFEDLPLDAFGNRLPSLAFEVFRSPAGGAGAALEDRVQAVDLIPASGEFAYASVPVREDLGPGRQNWINLKNGRGAPDFLAAIDDLEAQLPQCRSVLIVSAWFGSDLRCDACEIRPGVETRERITRPLVWSVAGTDRQSAYLVSQLDGRPAYGGTPDDAALIGAIGELKARGFKVSLYPFILMDIPAGNGLPDPHGANEQAAFPWRGRISCHPAPGEPGSPDRGAAATLAVDSFFGSAGAGDFSISGEAVAYAGPAEWRFNRFILHHAALAVAAGGVDGFLIGSEMRGLTTVRGPANSFPAVERLRALATEARALLGPGTRLSYAADWSEYFGYHPADGSGDIFFHLDPLWAADEIDAVAIDWYAPLADWRDGDHLDAAMASGPHDAAYLAGQVEGGEGFDWFYASPADRDAQVRTPISDGAYGKDWVFRYKDIRNWWRQAHVDRIGGVEQAEATAWQPESKPVWLTELGCPAVDKGANQPNVFIDPKSGESRLPHYSSGARDDLIQRRYLETLLDHWSGGPSVNPVSNIYGGPMIDPADIHVWTWDARPFPDFPVREAVWSDGGNWRLGHWLNGRAGLAPLALVVGEIAARAGVTIDADELGGLVSGFVIDRTMPAKRALEPLTQAYGFALADGADGVRAIGTASIALALPVDALVLPEAGSALSTDWPEPVLLPRDLRLHFRLDSPDYRPASVYARHATGDLEAVIDLSLPLLADETTARFWSAALLAQAGDAALSTRFSLPPSRLALDAGDVVSVADQALQLRTVSGQAARDVEAGPPVGRGAIHAGTRPDRVGGVLTPPAQPVLKVLDLALLPTDTQERNGVLVAAAAAPWPGAVTVHVGPSADALGPRADIRQPARIGTMIAAAGRLAAARWHSTARLTVKMISGELLGATRCEILDGANRIAIATAAGWQTLQFETATLIAPDTYALTGLLSPDEIDLDGLGAGGDLVVLDDAVIALAQDLREVPLANAALARGVIPDPGVHDIGAHTYRAEDLRPLAVAHLAARKLADGFLLRWIRRTRIGGDDWSAPDVPLGEETESYEVSLWQGGEVRRRLVTTTPDYGLDMATIVDAVGPSPVSFTAEVRQISTKYGAGRAAAIALTA